MKATLTFNEDERAELLLAIHAGEIRSALDSIRDKVRTMWKHGEYDDATTKVIDEIYQHICDECAGIPE